MREFGGFVFLVGLAMLAAIVMAIVDGHAQPSKPVWVRKDCITAQCVTDTLNSLSPERALEAKVMAYSSNRTMLGAAYGVWYRQ